MISGVILLIFESYQEFSQNDLPFDMDIFLKIAHILMILEVM